MSTYVRTQRDDLNSREAAAKAVHELASGAEGDAASTIDLTPLIPILGRASIAPSIAWRHEPYDAATAALKRIRPAKGRAQR